MTARNHYSLTLEQLADVAGITPRELPHWLETEEFRPVKLSEKESGTVLLSSAEALVLKLGVTIFDEMRFSAMPISEAAALVHAHQANCWKRGQSLVVAAAPIARAFRIAKFSYHHAISDTYSGVMRPRDVTCVYAETPSFTGLAVIGLTKLENEVRRLLKSATIDVSRP